MSSISDIVKERLEAFKSASDEEQMKILSDLENRVKNNIKKKSTDLDDICDAICYDTFFDAKIRMQEQKLKEKWKKRYSIFDTIKEWCEKHYYTDMLVTICADDVEITTVMYADGLEKDNYEFLDDWDEGQSSIKLEGFMPLDSIRIFTNGQAPREAEERCININSDSGWWSAP